jgi:hypothetical protein
MNNEKKNLIPRRQLRTITPRNRMHSSFDNVPIEGQLNLIRGWVAIAGETHGEDCAEAWQQVKRLANNLERRADEFATNWQAPTLWSIECKIIGEEAGMGNLTSLDQFQIQRLRMLLKILDQSASRPQGANISRYTPQSIDYPSADHS